MPEIKITIRDKVAIANGVVYICGNSDYTLAFDFDEEWGEYETKTARFVYGEKYTDVVFSGDTCQVPVLTNLYGFKVGVFAGDLHTTTPAKVAAKKSILCDKGAPADPAPDVYNQIMERLNSGGGSGSGGVSSWNDLADRPFYSEYETGTVLAETSPAFDEEQSAFILTDPIRITTGEEYTVNWNGTNYTCVCSEVDIEGVPFQALGNLGAMGVGDDTGEPFLIFIVPADMVAALGGTAQIMPLDGSTELTVSITGTVETVHQIPVKYIPNATVCIDVETESLDINLRSYDTTEIVDAILNDAAIYVNLNAKSNTDCWSTERLVGVPFFSFANPDQNPYQTMKAYILTGISGGIDPAKFPAINLKVHSLVLDEIYTIHISNL